MLLHTLEYGKGCCGVGYLLAWCVIDGQPMQSCPKLSKDITGSVGQSDLAYRFNRYNVSIYRIEGLLPIRYNIVQAQISYR
jgi:hypothetical protein